MNIYWFKWMSYMSGVVDCIHSISEKFVTSHLDRIFVVFGIPEIVRSDNGPPFQSKEFAAFFEFMGFKHR